MFLVAVVLSLVLPQPASAHAFLERTNPADGTALEQPPDHLALYFSEHVVLEATRIELVDSGGHVTALGGLELVTDEPDDTEVPSVVTADLPSLPRDSYRVRWSTLSSDDLHRTSGFFVFGVGTTVTASGFHEPPPRPLESGLRWLLLLGLALALGSLLVGRLVRSLPVDGSTTSGTGRATGRLRRLGAGGAAVAALVAVALLADQWRTADLSGPDLVASGYAGRWALREVGLLAVLVAVVASSHRSRLSRLTLVSGCLGAALGSALLGHAGADPGPVGTRLVATAVHLLAVLTWAGGVVCLALVLLPALVGPGHAPPAWRLLRSFGRPAATCLGVGVATGLYLTSSTVASVDAALATTYGRVWLLKVSLVGLMAVLAALNHRRVHGPHDLDLPRRGVRAEAAAAVLVLAATGVLTSAQPATEPQFQRPLAATAGPVATQVDDLRVQLDVAPGVPGLNVVSVDVFNTRRPAPGEVTAVSIDVGSGTTLAATPLGNGRWSVSGVDLPAGPRQLRVTVTRPGVRTAQLTTPWSVGSGDPAHRTVVSSAPLSGILQALSIALGLLVALLWWAGRSRRRGGGTYEVDQKVTMAVGPGSEAAPAGASGALKT